VGNLPRAAYISATMAETTTLYDTDFLRWTEEQAKALREAKGASLPLDWENLAEEIESLGISQRAALRAQLRRVLHHLFKLEASPASDPRAGWRRSVRDAREEVEDILQDSPSLRREVAGLVAAQAARAAKMAADDLADHGGSSDAIRAQLDKGSFTVEEVLGDWFPEKE